MTNYINTRPANKRFTMAEFKEIPRNVDGDIIDLEDAYPFISKVQMSRLTDYDYSRMGDLDEEMRAMIAEFYD